jgi:ketosteroid isomerase-like protein
MTRANEKVVRRMFERWSAADITGWLDCWHTDAEWISDGTLTGDAQTYVGHADLLRLAVDTVERLSELGRVERPRFRHLDDSVLALGEYTTKAGTAGPGTSTPRAWLFEIRDGKIVRGRGFPDPAEALEAIASQPVAGRPRTLETPGDGPPLSGRRATGHGRPSGQPAPARARRGANAAPSESAARRRRGG